MVGVDLRLGGAEKFFETVPHNNGENQMKGGVRRVCNMSYNHLCYLPLMTSTNLASNSTIALKYSISVRIGEDYETLYMIKSKLNCNSLWTGGKSVERAAGDVPINTKLRSKSHSNCYSPRTTTCYVSQNNGSRFRNALPIGTDNIKQMLWR